MYVHTIIFRIKISYTVQPVRLSYSFTCKYHFNSLSVRVYKDRCTLATLFWSIHFSLGCTKNNYTVQIYNQRITYVKVWTSDNIVCYWLKVKNGFRAKNNNGAIDEGLWFFMSKCIFMWSRLSFGFVCYEIEIRMW